MARVRRHVPGPEQMNHDRAGLKPLLQSRRGKSPKETPTSALSVIQAVWFQLLSCVVNYRALCALAYREYGPRGVQENLECGGLFAARDLIHHSSRKGKSYEQYHLYGRLSRCHHRSLVVFWTALGKTELSVKSVNPQKFIWHLAKCVRQDCMREIVSSGFSELK